ncbi:Xylulose kinase [Streptomyces sp. ADI96-02]|uniref:FGGY-family carbohydrate kinase n=1 Tax=Streptomyces sp. ADI96-02 TaxID=1522760 RepID=UPI000F54DC04|nr:FGGY-family carbohydrate kinase [Streptomyces sp. ADI96-02]RPK54859.1 Xylulose kinase [Streptomyces sp. ADI96-02]
MSGEPHATAPRSPAVIGVDVATASVRVLCVDGRGHVLAEARRDLPPPVRGGDGASEQDARSWWPAVRSALRRTTSALPRGGREVVAVAVSATSGTIVPAGADGEPLGPALMYDDRRAADANAEAQRAGRARWDALGLSVGPTAALGRAVRCLRTYGSGLRHVLHTPDVVGRELTGRPVPADWSHALKTGYDPLAGEWAHEVFDAFDFPLALLPDVRAPGTEAGRVGPRAAEATGLPEGCSVRLGMTDGCAGQIATGAVEPGRFVGVLGTTYVLKGVSADLVRDATGALYSHRHPDGWWLPGGASNTGGECLADVDPARLPALDAAAGARGPAAYVCYPLRREGERFPFVSGAARGFALGSPRDEAEAHRAALEGVAFVERLALERVERLGIPVSGPLYAAGGGSRSPVWTAIRATVLNRPVRVVERAETAFGAALLAASGTLHENLSASAEAMVRAGALVEPEPDERSALDDGYGRFTAALRERGWLPED